jgi:DNA-binding MarR family transcriptional regulator
VSVKGRASEEFLDQLGRLSRCLRAHAAQAYGSFEVGPTQARFLRHIGQNSGISQAELARATLTDAALTGRALQTLLERGWVRRKRSARDRRQYVLELSAAGQRARKRVDAARKRLADQVVGVLEPGDLVDFERISGRVVAAFSAEPGVSSAAEAK